MRREEAKSECPLPSSIVSAETMELGLEEGLREDPE